MSQPEQYNQVFKPTLKAQIFARMMLADTVGYPNDPQYDGTSIPNADAWKLHQPPSSMLALPIGNLVCSAIYGS